MVIYYNLLTNTFFKTRYIDSYRSVSTQLGGGKEDLKDKMVSSGINATSEVNQTSPGNPNDVMYLRQVRILQGNSMLHIFKLYDVIIFT